MECDTKSEGGKTIRRKTGRGERRERLEQLVPLCRGRGRVAKNILRLRELVTIFSKQ